MPFQIIPYSGYIKYFVVIELKQNYNDYKTNDILQIYRFEMSKNDENTMMQFEIKKSNMRR